jgi:hypothetical protein
MTLPPLKICRRIRQLFRLIGSTNTNEAASAREKLVTVLTKHALSWNDIPACVAEADAADISNAPKPTASYGAAGPGPEVNVLDLVLHLIELHISISPMERLAIALWILHTYIFDRFDVTPRLAVLSPASGCGKTALLILLDLLAADSYRTDSISPATIYHLLDRRSHTLLIDEGENLGLLSNPLLRAVFNSGHRRGGAISRFVNGRPQRYSTFAPLAVAAIKGAPLPLPLPLLHRSVVIDMQRSPKSMARLDERDPTFPASRDQIRRWSASCALTSDPDMPSSLRNRESDNWRPLLAIADDLGHGESARAAAVGLCANRPDEDPGVIALTDTRTIFFALNADRIASAALTVAMHDLDDGMWTDWRGPHDDRQPHKLTQSELARLLRPFGIRPRTIWPANRGPGSKSYRGYLRSWFESAWAAYCPSPDTPTQASKIIHLPRPQADT